MEVRDSGTTVANAIAGRGTRSAHSGSLSYVRTPAIVVAIAAPRL